MGAKQQIVERFTSLSPTLQRAARFVVDHPNEVIIGSMRQVAAQAGAQPATLVRLAQQLGYAGWPDLKSAFAADMGLHASGYGERARRLAARGGSTELAGEMFSAQRDNLAATAAQSGPALRAAGKLLQRAPRVHVAGFRASFPVAYAFFYGYRLFRDTVHLIDGSSGGLELQLRAVGRGDAVLVVSFAPYSTEAMAVIASARASGARIVALTDSLASPLALDAHVTVPFAAASPSFFPSVTAAVALAEALLELLVADAGPAVARQIAHTEQQLFDSGAYVQQPARRPIPRRR